MFMDFKKTKLLTAALICRIILASSNSLANPDRENLGNTKILPDDVLKLIALKAAAENPENLISLSQTCKYMNEKIVNSNVVRNNVVTGKLAGLIGNLQWLGSGSFVMPPNEGHATERYMEIKDGFFIAEDYVTQAQYQKLMGEDEILKRQPENSPLAPVVAWSRKDMGPYIQKLNAKLEKLWPVLHPGEKLVASMPEYKELAYGATEPLPPGQVEEVRVDGKPPYSYS